MAKCEFCGKDVKFGIKVSHSHRRSNRTWKPNVQRVILRLFRSCSDEQLFFVAKKEHFHNRKSSFIF